MSDVLNHALQLASWGFRVHPLRTNSKLPLLSGWPQAATSNAEAVRAWWTATPSAGIGIATGQSFFVLDVDTAAGKPGAASLAALVAKHGSLPATLTARTASGGLHHYFASAAPIRNSAGKLGEALDIRGAGGYVVGPPTTIDGNAYEWQSIAPITPAPAWLVALASAAAPILPASTPSASPAAAEASLELLADLRSALAVLPAEDRDTWIKAGAALRALGANGRELWLEWSARSAKHDPDNDPQVFETIGHNSTGPAAIFAAAARLGWDNPATLRRAANVFGHQQVSASPTLHRVEIADVMHAHVPPPRFVVDRLIPAGHLTLFGSHGGSGKSILALAISAHVAAGAPWAGFAVEHRTVLFVSLEDPGELVRFRLRKVIDGYSLDAAMVTANLSILDGSAGLSALMTERAEFGQRRLVATATLDELRAAVGNAGLIVIDNASDAYDGDENARRQVRTFVRELAALGRTNHAGVLLLAHIDKAAAKFGSSGNSYSGSSAWHNSARSRLALVNSKTGVELVQEKLNLGRAALPIRLCWSPDGVLLPDRATHIEGAANSDADALLQVMATAARNGVSVPTARTGPATTQRVLETLVDFPDRLRGTRGREDFWSAIGQLQESKRIAIEEYQTTARHTRERFIVAPIAPVSPVPLNSAIGEREQGTAPVAPVPCAGGMGVIARAELAHKNDPAVIFKQAGDP